MSNQEQYEKICDEAKKYEKLIQTLADIEGELRVTILRMITSFLTLQEMIKKDGEL